MAHAEQAVMSEDVHDIVRRIQTLTPEEQGQVRRLLEANAPDLVDDPSVNASLRLRERMRQIGLLGPASPSRDPLPDYVPIPVEGITVSELLIQERR